MSMCYPHPKAQYIINNKHNYRNELQNHLHVTFVERDTDLRRIKEKRGKIKRKKLTNLI